MNHQCSADFFKLWKITWHELIHFTSMERVDFLLIPFQRESSLADSYTYTNGVWQITFVAFAAVFLDGYHSFTSYCIEVFGACVLTTATPSEFDLTMKLYNKPTEILCFERDIT